MARSVLCACYAMLLNYCQTLNFVIFNTLLSSESARKNIKLLISLMFHSIMHVYTHHHKARDDGDVDANGGHVNKVNKRGVEVLLPCAINITFPRYTMNSKQR